jgi:hypothetical protein
MGLVLKGMLPDILASLAAPNCFASKFSAVSWRSSISACFYSRSIKIMEMVERSVHSEQLMIIITPSTVQIEICH